MLCREGHRALPFLQVIDARTVKTQHIVKLNLGVTIGR